MLALALAAGGLAASRVAERTRAIDMRVGAPVPVVVAGFDVAPGTDLGADVLRRRFTVRRVPRTFVPPDALAHPAEASGLRTVAAIPRGGYLTAGAVEPPRVEPEAGPALRRGERAAEVAVASAGPGSGMEPGASVDVLVTTEGRSGVPGRTYVALERVELLGLRQGEPAAGPEATGGRALATLRVTARQAVLLTAAGSFAREVRLLARPPGDSRPIGALAVDGRGL